MIPKSENTSMFRSLPLGRLFAVATVSVLTLMVSELAQANPNYENSGGKDSVKPNNKHYDRGYGGPVYQQRGGYYVPAPVQAEPEYRHHHHHRHRDRDRDRDYQYRSAPRATYWVPSHQVWRGGIWVSLPGYYNESYVPPMPAVVYEPIPRYAHPDYIWVRGHWAWGGISWIWNGGRWIGR